MVRLCVSSLHICIVQPSELCHAHVFLQLYLLCALSNPSVHLQCFSSHKWWIIQSISHSLVQKKNKNKKKKTELKWECVWGQTGWMRRTEKQVTAIVGHCITGFWEFTSLKHWEMMRLWRRAVWGPNKQNHLVMKHSARQQADVIGLMEMRCDVWRRHCRLD